MSARVRGGGEWGMVTTGDLNGGWQGGSVTGRISLVTPGRTGGMLYRYERPATGSAYTADLTIGYGDMADAVVAVIGRSYVRLDTLPGVNVCFMQVGNVQAMVTSAGKLRPLLNGIAQSVAGGYDPTLPTDEWMIVELVDAWSASSSDQLRRGMRVTLPGEDPQVMWWECAAGGLGTDTAIGIGVAVGCLNGSSDPGAGFVMDFDDLGVNTDEGAEHNTWLGPGEVRIARPVSTVSAADVFECGIPSNNGHGTQGRTIPDDPEIPPLIGDPLEVVDPDDFAAALAHVPPTQVTAYTGRREHADNRVISSGTDWHVGNAGGDPGYTWTYDYPRRSDTATDALVLACDAADQAGDISFAQAIGTAYLVGYGTAPQDPPADDRYFSAYTDTEDAPAAGGDPDDEACQNFGQWEPMTERVGFHGRPQQSPAMGTLPELTIRREFASSVATIYPWYEFTLQGVGIVYESGYVPQDALPGCLRLMALI